MRDPLTGKTRVIFGDDQGVWTATDRGDGLSTGNVGSAISVAGGGTAIYKLRSSTMGPRNRAFWPPTLQAPCSTASPKTMASRYRAPTCWTAATSSGVESPTATAPA